MQQRLLVLSCSQKKNTTPGTIPAIERYDGPAFRVLRRYRRENGLSRFPATFVISAKFGLIGANEKIPYYDQKLSIERMRELRPFIQNQFAEILNKGDFEESFISAGSLYLQALGHYSIPNGMEINVSSGPPGKKLGELKRWLWNGNTRDIPVVSEPVNGVILNGIEINYSLEEIMGIAREALKIDPEGASRFYSWYVLVGEQSVAPKWLVSQLTGLPVGDFHTRSAIRVLNQLGVEVKANE